MNSCGAKPELPTARPAYLNPRSNDIGIDYSWHDGADPQLYRVVDFMRKKVLFGPATRQECQEWMRENVA